MTCYSVFWDINVIVAFGKFRIYINSPKCIQVSAVRAVYILNIPCVSLGFEFHQVNWLILEFEMSYALNRGLNDSPVDLLVVI